MSEPAAVVVGFDLDMTLVDSRPGIAATLAVLAEETGVALDVEAITARLGPPLGQMLAPYFPAAEVDGAVDRFRVAYPEHAIAPTVTLPGAEAALAAVRRHAGRTVLVTGKFTPNAHLHVAALALDVDEVVGEVWGTGKGAVLERHGATVYVGDHVHDVEGALAAGATSVSVLTGGCTEEELRAAGTHAVLTGLAEFPDWLEAHLLEVRLAALESDLEARESVMVAFSGGADSALLLAAAVRALGPDRVAAATAYSDSLPQAERSPALAFARDLGVRVLTPETREMEREGYRANDGDRCYFCKAELIDVLTPLAEEHGIRHVATGTNADDLVAGFRPGVRAARERSAITPLADAGLTKQQVRAASRAWGLPTWDKPAAACLSSRVAFGVEVSPFRLARVERAEVAVRALLDGAGVPLQNLRVRDLGDRARVELDAALLPGLTETGRDIEVRAAVRAAGFDEVEIDPRGFRSGAMDELLPDPVRFR